MPKSGLFLYNFPVALGLSFPSRSVLQGDRFSCSRPLVLCAASPDAPTLRRSDAIKRTVSLNAVKALATFTLLSFAALSSFAQTTLTFQQGVNGYFGTADTDLRQATPNTVQQNDAFNDVIFVDAQSAGQNDAVHALIRFDGIFGNGVGQIPIGTTISSATLRLTVPTGRNADGQGGTLHKMLVSWPETATWNSLVNGVQADNSEAATAVSSAFGDGTTILQPGNITVNVLSDVQFWSSGGSNFGWAILPFPGGTNGWGFSSRDQATISSRPLLTITAAGAPEPGTLALLVPGLLIGGGMVRRRRSHRK